MMTTRLQSNPTERHFFQYSQIIGGRFLVCLQEVLNAERILQRYSLMKEMLITPENQNNVTVLEHIKLEMLIEKTMHFKCSFLLRIICY